MLWLAHFPPEWVYSQKRDNKGAVCPTSPGVYTLPYLFVSRSALTPDAFNWFKVCEEMLCFHTCGFERYVLFWKDLTKSSLLPYSWIWPQLPPHLQPALCQTRKCAQETAVPHIRLSAPGQVHPGKRAMCELGHAVDAVRGAVTVIRVTMNFIHTADKNKPPWWSCYWVFIG